MSLGIDFGTTHTVVAFADRGNYPLVSFELDSGEALDTFPSVVAARDGELRFGLDALAVAGDERWSQARSFKRLLARQSLRAGGTLLLGGREVALPELLTGFLASLERALRTRSNLPAQLKKAPRLEAVVASPANAFCTQRFMTLEAFRGAGFTVRAMLNEPSAAGFEYAHRHARTLTSKREHVLVYDLGGGTFDASLVLMTGVRHDVVQTAGLAELGGDDFDDVLVQLVAKAAKLDLAALTPWFRGRLTEACRLAKEQLTPNTRRITVDLEGCLGERAPSTDVTVAAADYALACQPLVDRTIAAMQPLLKRLPGDDDRSSRAEPRDDVAGLYVVGGGSELPVVARTLKEQFGRRVHRSPHPHGAVAIGLAIASDQALRFELSDRFSRHFGVFREAEGGRAATYDTIFGRETELPRPGKSPLEVVRRYRAAHNLGHFRFFECAGFDARGYPQGDIAPMSTVRFPFEAALRDQPLDAVAVRRLESEGPRVTERYTVDEQGLVEVSITNEDAGFTTRHALGGHR
jgi:molecular chaperone DnaK (HSP70)